MIKILILDFKRPGHSTIGEFTLPDNLSDHLRNEGNLDIKIGGLYKEFEPNQLNIFLAKKTKE